MADNKISKNPTLVCSLSGGLDSPVAAYMMIKRDCNVVFVHVLNATQSQIGVRSKIDRIVEKLSSLQKGTKLYIVPFEKLQKHIIMCVPAKYRMIIYRRFMMRIMNDVASKEGAKGIITGDSVGQVASQTMDNMNCIYNAAKYPVISPLLGFNKEEIINISKKIGTYEYSIEPHPDCCSFMIAKHPETKCRLRDALSVERLIEDSEQLVDESVKEARIIEF
ncbi:hypothetical protein HQ545_06635 [Candidatus Woesearchaeota archaeon]|nr:hypothetical protein [Candidatus Woesearchaeota archaeon]